MHERVRGYADAVLDGLKDKDRARAAAQLEEFSALLTGSQDLHTAFALPTTSPASRRGIVESVLAGKALAPVVKLLAYTAQEGSGSDFDEDVAELAGVSGAKASGLVQLEAGLAGRHAARERTSGYARALLSSVPDQKRLGNIEDELFRFMRTVEGSDDLRVALTTNQLPVSVRHNLARDLLAKRATEETRRIAVYAVDSGRPRDYVELLGHLVDQVAAEARRRVADVRSAVDMSDAQQLRLAGALTRLTGTAVDVRVTVEPSLLGGFVATVGDLVVDASLKLRLTKARDLLTAPGTKTAAPPGGAPGVTRKD